MSLILSKDHSHHSRHVNTDAVGLGNLAAGSPQSSTRTRIRLVPSKRLPAPHSQRTASTATNPFAGYLHQANPTMQQAKDHAYYLSQFADPPSSDQFTEDRLRCEFPAEDLTHPQHHLNDINYYPADNSKGSYANTSETASYPDTASYSDTAFRDYQQAAGAIGTHPRSIAEIREAHGYDCDCKRCRYYKTLSTFPAPYRRELERRELKRLSLREERKRKRYLMEMQAMEMKRAGRVHWDVEQEHTF